MFERFEKMIGSDNLKKIQNTTVLVVGIGGVGGYVVESLIRSGIGKIILIDNDIVDPSNKNRQLIALDSTVGEKKVDVMKRRIKDINNDCQVIAIDTFLNEDNKHLLHDYSVDYIVDACDTINSKKIIIKEALKNNITFISSMGTGNKLDPSKLEVTDIRKTINDPIARIMRKWVKDEKINKKIPVVSSSEVPIKVKDIVASNSFVPASAGLLISSYIINNIIKK